MQQSQKLSRFLFVLLCTLSYLMQGVYSLKFLVINDIHLNITESTPYPMPGTEASIPLLQTVISHAKSHQNDDEPLTAILLPGDFCAHHMSAKVGATSTPDWPSQLETMSVIMQLLSDAFPTIPILPSVGNNDVMYHDQAPTSDQKNDYYSQMWQVMFQNVTGNNQTNINGRSSIADNTTIKQNWMEGGYYAYEVSDEFVVISINGMYPFSENVADLEMADTMIDWVGELLANITGQGKYFMVEVHVWPGFHYFDGMEQFWYQNYTEKWLQMIAPYIDYHVLTLGAHIHRVSVLAAEIPAQYRSADSNYESGMVTIISPAVSPIYGNNPAYGWLTINPNPSSQKYEIQQFKFPALQLEDERAFKTLSWQEWDLGASTRIEDLNSPSAIQRYWSDYLMTNQQSFAWFTARSLGMRDYLVQGIMFSFQFSQLKWSAHKMQIGYSCACLYWLESQFPSYCQKAAASQ